MAERGAPKGNKNAAKEHRMVTDELRKVATQGVEKLRKACEKILEKAAEGDIASFNVLADRLDGKAAQSLTIGGDEENPIRTVNKVEIAALKSDD